MKYPSRVLIVGGTHGNEWTGIQVIRHYQDHFKKKFPGLSLEFVLANPEAFKLNRRFIDEDLNRAFQYLHETRTSYEHGRAHEIKQLINQAPCFVLDLHTTTSNMGSTLIVSDYNPLNLHLCAQLTAQFQDCRAIGCPDPHKKYLASQSPYGLILEVGPVANSVVAPAPLESTLALLDSILGIIEAQKINLIGSVELYEEYQDVHYPQDAQGEISAHIHCDFQGKDFQEIEGKYTPFQNFAGREIEMKTEKKLYPIFINEAAYYPQKLAFTLCQKKRINVNAHG